MTSSSPKPVIVHVESPNQVPEANEGLYKNDVRYILSSGLELRCKSTPGMKVVIDNDGNVKNEAFIGYEWVIQDD